MVDETVARPLVSAIVPIYNHERWVVGCLDSLARQDYPRIELIAIDDGSRDDSYAIAQAWLEAHGHRFERWELSKQQNQGVPRTCNLLVQRSRGELIFPLASDDEALPRAVSTLVAAYDPKRPEILFSDLQIMDLEGRTVAESTAAWNGRNLVRLATSPWYLRWQIATTWGTPFQHQVYPRRLFDELGGYDETLKFEDAAFALRAMARGRIRFLTDCTRRYRVRPDGSPSPGIALQDATLIPSRRAVRNEFGPVMRSVFALLDLHERAPNLRPRIEKFLRRIAHVAKLVGK